MLTVLNTQQKAFKDIIKNEWKQKFLTPKIDILALKKGINFIYTKLKLKRPKIYICADPLKAVKLAQILGGKKIKLFHYVGLGYDSGWLSFYDYFYQLGIIKSTLFKKYRDFISCGAFAYIFFDTFVIAIMAPVKINRDNSKRLHSETEAALEFPGDVVKLYRWHGIPIPKEVILNPDSITKEFIEKEKNSEVLRAIAEKLGWNKYLQIVDVVLLDKWFDCNTSCHYELYDFKIRNGDLQPRLLKMESPEILDGTRPCYIEPVPPDISSCQAARRWQCDPNRPDVQECNKSPEFIFESEY